MRVLILALSVVGILVSADAANAGPSTTIRDLSASVDPAKRVDGRLMLVRDEIDRAFDLAMSEVCGIELEPDEKDGTFLD